MNNHQTNRDAVHILVAEDSFTQALSLQYLLEQQGYGVTVCENGRLALAEAKRRKPTLVISDIVMPEMDGYGLCRAFKSDADLNDVPFLLVTTLSDPEDVLRGLEAGADSFILKPYDDPFLLNRVSFVLLHRRLRQTDRAEMGVEITFKGRSHFITSDRLQILNLLLSTYEAAIQRNDELRRSEEELREANNALSAANARLEEEIRQRQTVERQLAAAKQQAEAANEAKSAFLATMSHEIRTPMNGIVGMVDVLAHGQLSEYQADALRTIKDSAFALLHLIDDLLDFSKIEAGKLELEHTAVSLSDVAEGVCDTLSALADRKGVDLFVFVSPEGPSQVLSDPVRLRQILYNLVGNAIKFSADRPEQRGRVDVRVELASENPLRVAFSVSDNGIGISPDARAHLFESFRQAEISTTRRFGGTGLGLAICKRLVDLMHGEIQVESTPGCGTTFTVTVPLEPVADASALAFPDLSDVDYVIMGGPNARAHDLCSYLEHAGARVTLAADADEAVSTSAQMAMPIVVHGGIDEAWRNEWMARFDALPHVRHLLISRGRRRVGRLTGVGVITVDGNSLRRRSLLNAAAAAAGLASPATEQWRSASQPEVDVTAPTIAQARARGQLILVAEDDSTNQKVLLRQLNLLGYAAELASNGEEALNLWRRDSYAMLLTDLHMPVMDGYALTAAIRREEAEPGHFPIVALTANALRGEANQAFAAGMDDYLTKPLQLPALRDALQKWLPKVRGEGSSLDGQLQRTAAPAIAREVLNLNVLRGLIGDDPASLRVLLEDFHDALQGMAASIRAAATTGDFGEVGSLAHRLKSSSRSVGAIALGDACAELENGSRLGDSAFAMAAVGSFEAAVQSLLPRLKEHLEKEHQERGN